MKRLAIVLIPLLIVGCATVSKTYTANGREAYTLNCSGLTRGWDKCLKAAGDLCGTKGYEILDRSDESSVSVSGDSSGFFGAKTNERSMLVTCNNRHS